MVTGAQVSRGVLLCWTLLWTRSGVAVSHLLFRGKIPTCVQEGACDVCDDQLPSLPAVSLSTSVIVIGVHSLYRSSCELSGLTDTGSGIIRKVQRNTPMCDSMCVSVLGTHAK